jgi:hypothetical protein
VEVWLASYGSYSDYRVHCAFTTKELAVAYVASLNGLTVDEQRMLSAIDDVVPWNEYQAALAQLPKNVRQTCNEHFVESRDLYDTVPIVGHPAAV